MHNFFSVESISQSNYTQALVAFVPAMEKVWKETADSVKPVRLSNSDAYMPWGASNDIPFGILEQIESDETVTTCQQHNIKNCYAAGLEYVADNADDTIRHRVQRFMLRNDMPAYYLGVCTDMKFWGFAVSVLTLSKDGTEITNIERLEAMYCRFSEANHGNSAYVYYAMWRDNNSPKDYFRFPILDSRDPLGDLETRLGRSPLGGKMTKDRQFAVVTRIPTPDSTYYPIPYYAALFKGKWFDIKQLIALGKYYKLKNAAPLKYIVQVSDSFWERLFVQAAANNPDEERAVVDKAKKDMIDFITGVENSGRTLFSGCYIDPATGHEIPDVKITCLEKGKEGGDWETDIQEAINMVCFTMGVHSNLVGSVPGKSQSNNSGSDKRELYMIAQLLNRPTHDLLLRPHRIICAFNHWEGVKPECQIMQLTTLDEHKDVKPTADNGQPKKEDTK